MHIQLSKRIVFNLFLRLDVCGVPRAKVFPKFFEGLLSVEAMTWFDSDGRFKAFAKLVEALLTFI